MMTQPPIDKLIEMIDSKYALCCLIAKRARQLLDKKPELLEETNINAISYAAQEVYEGKVQIAKG
ncbi:MAG TPA: DNA-directed RNA polymerase subunit omega [Clostridiales bacterium]|jgi:DNA-directed RNA polymerase subunit omega|nr:DNA-directed RNA polymerase subunit omega [Clostridiales bacterium]